MLRTAILTLFLLPLQMLFAEQQITGTITEVMDINNNKMVLLDINHKSIRNKLAASIVSDNGFHCYMQQGASEISRAPVLIQKKNGGFWSMDHNNYGADIGIGTGLCVAGCVFVLVAGESFEGGKPEGAYVQMGDGGGKQVTGGLACIPGALWAAGCIFLLKGVIEIFIPSKNTSYDSYGNGKPADKTSDPVASDKITPLFTKTLKNTSSTVQTTDEIITAGNYRIVNRIEKTVSINDYSEIENWVKRFCLSM